MHIKLKLPDERLSWDMMMVYDKGSYTNKIVQVPSFSPFIYKIHILLHLSLSDIIVK